ncbi:MAG: TonB-dependent receptor plug domain-containing protein, partial [Prevotella sp.]|nr:TonB-dependent receptor plug domain-containing protein [Prevotella sp.]
MRRHYRNVKVLLAASALTFMLPTAGYSETPGTLVVEQNDGKGIVRGTVVDDNGSPVIGASVIVKGSKQGGTITDVDGRFALKAPAGAVITVSYVGYDRAEVRVQPGKQLNITLKGDTQVLDDVIVTGYGTFKKSAYAGSASTVKTDNIKDVPTISLNEMLQGAAPGVTMQSSSGMPGSYTALNIRGMGSFNASNSPLYVVDGVPVISGNIDNLGTDAGLDALSTLNPSDIESLTVIKDAAAASLYGSRAANGVVVITTKKGREGKAKVNFKADWGFSDFAMEYRKTLNGEQRYQAIYDAFYNADIEAKYTEAEAIED